MSNRIIIAAFPQSVTKIVVQDEESEKVIGEHLVWMPDFKETFPTILESSGEVSRIHILGPNAYVGKVIEFIQGITDVPVVKEG